LVRDTSCDESMIAATVVAKLGTAPGVPYSKIARAAETQGRSDLAIQLLDYEPRASEQVPLLVKMRRHDIALEKAALSGDGDLLLDTLLTLQRKTSAGEFFNLVHRNPIAEQVFLRHGLAHDQDMVRDFLRMLDLRAAHAHVCVRDAYDQDDAGEWVSGLKVGAAKYQQASLSPEQRHYAWHTKAT